MTEEKILFVSGTTFAVILMVVLLLLFSPVDGISLVIALMWGISSFLVLKNDEVPDETRAFLIIAGMVAPIYVVDEAQGWFNSVILKWLNTKPTN